MSIPLLSTKLYIPIPRETIVHRQRLLDQLNRGRTRKFILISAPAGFGKTTLLSTWIDRNQLPAAWLTLDEMIRPVSWHISSAHSKPYFQGSVTLLSGRYNLCHLHKQITTSQHLLPLLMKSQKQIRVTLC